MTSTLGWYHWRELLVLLRRWLAFLPLLHFFLLLRRGCRGWPVVGGTMVVLFGCIGGRVFSQPITVRLFLLCSPSSFSYKEGEAVGHSGPNPTRPIDFDLSQINSVRASSPFILECSSGSGIIALIIGKIIVMSLRSLIY